MLEKLKFITSELLRERKKNKLTNRDDTKR